MATLWLAAGENPEWIARQMGHTSTEMLFTVYSRFVPNLTRRDGSAIERMFENMGESADAPASEEGGAECRTV
jgi:integrase